MTPEEAADRIELRALVDCYGFAADSRDRDRFAGVFTPDGVLSVGGMELTGRDVIPSILDYLDAHHPKTMHLMGNHDVSIEGDTATGIVYCRAHHLSVGDDGATNTTMTIRYVDRYARTDGQWLIEHRTINIEWEEEGPAFAEPRPPRS
jgi:uncharacterized protein (TIGR02246 family)